MVVKVPGARVADFPLAAYYSHQSSIRFHWITWIPVGRCLDWWAGLIDQLVERLCLGGFVNIPFILICWVSDNSYSNTQQSDRKIRTNLIK